MFTILRNSLYRGLLYRGLTVIYSLLGLLIYLSYDLSIMDLSTLLLVSYLSTLEPDYTFEGSSTGEYRCKEAELAD